MATFFFVAVVGIAVHACANSACLDSCQQTVRACQRWAQACSHWFSFSGCIHHVAEKRLPRASRWCGTGTTIWPPQVWCACRPWRRHVLLRLPWASGRSACSRGALVARAAYSRNWAKCARPRLPWHRPGWRIRVTCMCNDGERPLCDNDHGSGGDST